MKKINMVVVALGFFLFNACSSNDRGAAKCERSHSVPFYDVAYELGKVYKCEQKPLNCSEPLSEFETLHIAGYSSHIPQWLWTGSDKDYRFNIDQQNGIIKKAIDLANANRPKSKKLGILKVIEKITFFWDAGDPMNPIFSIGANVTYATCPDTSSSQ